MSGSYAFSTGKVIATPYRDNQGNLVAVPTPINMESCTDLSLDIKADVKMHEGQQQWSVAAAGGKKTGEFSFTHNIIDSKSLTLLGGESINTGQEKLYEDQAAFTAVASDTIAPPGSGTFVKDLGVTFGETGGVDAGKTLTRVASAPAAGQYAVSNVGVYTYNATDVGKPIYRRYLYTVATGFSSIITNSDMGASPEFGFVMTSAPYRGVAMLFNFPICVVKDQSTPFKNGDFTGIKYSGVILANPLTKVVGTRSFQY